MIFTALIIDELIACEKLITEAPTREFKEENRHRRKDMRLQDCQDAKQQFSVFIRQSFEFDEDFSLGLVYLSVDGKRMTMIRYNGQHDQSNDPYDQAKTHFQYHIHKATPENLNNGCYDKHPASATGNYASFAEATHASLKLSGFAPKTSQPTFRA
jgi:hypothetical protein